MNRGRIILNASRGGAISPPMRMSAVERRCTHCGDTEDEAHLERCVQCGKWFCVDCAFKQTGRRFDSAGCARDYFWGQSDEDDEDDTTKREPPKY